MGVVDEVTRRAFRRHIRNAIGLEKPAQVSNYIRAYPRIPMHEIADLRCDHRPHLAAAKQWPDTTGMAHDDIARKPALRLAIDDRIGQRPDARRDAVSPRAVFHQRLDDTSGIGDAVPSPLRKREILAFRNVSDITPRQYLVDKDRHGQRPLKGRGWRRRYDRRLKG